MKTNASAPRDVDEYIAGFPNEVRTILEKVRTTIRKAAPGAQEKISYRIPTFTLDGKYLIYFAAFQKHVGLYPAPRGAEEFQEQLAAYGGGKGTVQFPFDKPIPFGLITRIVKFRVTQNAEKKKGAKPLRKRDKSGGTK